MSILVACVLPAATGLAWSRHSQGEIPYKVLPVDDGARDQEFVIFRRNLLHAARSGDLRSVLANVSRDVEVEEMSVRRGLSELRRVWELDKSPGAFLTELAEVLRLGGRMIDNGKFMAPYTWVGLSVDPDEVPSYAVVIVPNAPLRAAPRLDARVVAYLENDLVTFEPESGGWVYVMLRDGRRGFMKEEHARRVIAPRAMFEKRAGVWKLTGFYDGWH